MDYVPTQYIVDFIKSIEHNGAQEYDGIEYNSTTNPGGYNLAIFNPDLFECISVSVYDIEKLQYTSKSVVFFNHCFTDTHLMVRDAFLRFLVLSSAEAGP